MGIETLEARIALHAGHHDEPAGIETFPAAEPGLAGAAADGSTSSGSPAGASVGSLTVPAFDSLPGTAVSIYLDFDGDTTTDWSGWASINTPPYDIDGDAATFSAGELDAIAAIWAQVAEDFAPFKVNVTTVEPASFANGAAVRVDIGGDGAWTGGAWGGYAYIDSFTNSASNTVFVFSANLRQGNPKLVGDASSHESGHAFGLQHQSEYDSSGTKVAEYYAGPGDGRAPIMGRSYDAARGMWWYGTSALSSTAMQDDMAVISRPQNAFGYRADEDFDSAQTATPFSLGGDQANASGVVAKTADVDYWSFTTDTGVVTFNVTAFANNNLDVKARLVDASEDPSLAAWRQGAAPFVGTAGTPTVTTDYDVERI